MCSPGDRGKGLRVSPRRGPYRSKGLRYLAVVDVRENTASNRGAVDEGFQGGNVPDLGRSTGGAFLPGHSVVPLRHVAERARLEDVADAGVRVVHGVADGGDTADRSVGVHDDRDHVTR